MSENVVEKLKAKAKTLGEWKRLADQDKGYSKIFVCDLIPLEDVVAAVQPLEKKIEEYGASPTVSEKQYLTLNREHLQLWAKFDDLKTGLSEKEKRIRELEETCKVLSDEKLMKGIRKARKEGSKSSPYEPLVSKVEGKP